MDPATRFTLRRSIASIMKIFCINRCNSLIFQHFFCVAVSKHGILEIDDNQLVTSFLEKPAADATRSRLAVSLHRNKWRLLRGKGVLGPSYHVHMSK